MSSIFEAYLEGHAGAFFGGHFASADDRRRAVQRAVRPLAPGVARAVTEQNGRLAPSAARAAHVAALARGAAAVVTGQQVGLFLGPLYTLHKAATAVVVARALGAEAGKPVVPVFWLQTEDHDLAEIATCQVPGPDGEPVALRVRDDGRDRVAIAHRALPADVIACLDRLEATLGHRPHARAHLERLARHYRPGAGWAEAFAGLLGELFAAEGLVVVDPRDPALAAEAVPVHRRALRDAGSLAGALGERVHALAAAGFEAPVHVRPGAPLSFFHPDGPVGPRYRLEPAPGAPGCYAEVGGTRTHTLEALLDALDAKPLRFSTSALLRPILEDTWLPTAAVVCGPGEVAYFAQLAPLYAAYGLTMPLVVPRARLRLVDDGTARLLARLEAEPCDASRPEDELLALVRARGAPAAAATRDRALAAELLDAFETALARVAPRLAAAGPGLDVALEKTRDTVRAAVGRLADKVERAALHADEARVRDVRRLRGLLHPNGDPQERSYGVAAYAARCGERALVAQVLAAIAPFDAAVRDVRLAVAEGAP